MLRQKRMEASGPRCPSSVDPVVVNPLIASKVESSRLSNVPSIRNGTPPRRAATTQASVTER